MDKIHIDVLAAAANDQLQNAPNGAACYALAMRFPLGVLRAVADLNHIDGHGKGERSIAQLLVDAIHGPAS